MEELLQHIVFGLVSGFSAFTPISASAHQALFYRLMNFDSYQHLLLFFVHIGTLGAMVLLYWQRISHLYEQVQLLALPAGRRKRPPDVAAIMDIRLLLTAAIPALLGGLLSGFLPKITFGLLPLSLLLIFDGVAIYMPDYRPGGDRKARSMTPAEGVLMGSCAAMSMVCGLSAMGLMLSLTLLRKCDRQYMLDMALIICGIMLCGMIVVDAVGIILSGFRGVTALKLLGSVLAGGAAFGGGIGAILTMRFLAVKTSFSGFAFYNWGLGIFCFILYLMV